MTGDERGHRSLELGCPSTQLADLGQEGAGELGPDASDAVEGVLDRRELTSWATVRP
jgi:hypothetical protein